VLVPKGEALTGKWSAEEARQVVRRHILTGGKTVADLSLMNEVEPLSGGRIPVGKEGGTVIIGGASIVHGDIACTNGFIHILDRPLP
jgi:uncharacterized surface protein with fasciclin (FAS1) repeats